MSRTKNPPTGSLGFKLLIQIVAFSSVITLSLTLIQLFADYRAGIRSLQDRMAEIEATSLDSLGASLWEFDVEQLRRQLEGLRRLPDMQWLAIHHLDGPAQPRLLVAVGKRGAGAVLGREFPIVYRTGAGTPQRLGILHVEAGLSGVYSRLFHMAVMILISQGVKTFLVSSFILFIVHRQVTRHLVTIAEFVKHSRPTGPWARLALPRRPSRREDELDQIATAFNSSLECLQGAYRDLQDANVALEQRVRQRTAELEATNRELARSRAAAEQANLAKSRFLAAASHDLRQPFQAMFLYQDVLDNQVSDPTARRALSALGSAMVAGQDLLNTLLDISTLEAGITTPQIEVVPLQQFLRMAVAEFGDQAEQRGIALKFVPCSVMAATDPVLFGRMVRNLLANALKYTVSGRILIGCRREPGGVRVEVWDTGPGVPSDKQSEIWEEFTQLDNPERDRSRGLGLGLAIVARTGQLLNHPVGLRSWPGKGSVFFIRVPLARTAAPA